MSARSMRGVSQIVAALGLIAIAVVVAVLGYYIATNYASHAVKKPREIYATYARLVYLGIETGSTPPAAVYRGEIGVANPTGRTIDVSVCIVAGVETATGIERRVLTCTDLAVRPGHESYSFLVRIPIDQLSCAPDDCPVKEAWHFVITSYGNVLDVIEPEYAVP